jgi:hypothetical protein
LYTTVDALPCPEETAETGSRLNTVRLTPFDQLRSCRRFEQGTDVVPLTKQYWVTSCLLTERLRMLIEIEVGNPKDIHPLQRYTAAKLIDYYLNRNKVCEAVTKGQHSMTDVGNALGLRLSRMSRIVKA